MSKVVDVASQEIGYIEENGNMTKYGAWFGLNGLPWCAIFVSWVYAKAGIPFPKIGFDKGFAGVQLGYDYFLKNNMIVQKPEAGDLVLFDFNKDHRYDHVGIYVKEIGSGIFETIEGNTSVKNQRNGGMVMRRKRSGKVVFVKIKK